MEAFRRTASFAWRCGVVAALSIGCEGSTPTNPTPAPMTTAEAPAPGRAKALDEESVPASPPLELTSSDQALDEMVAAVDARRTDDYQTAEIFLQSRGPEIVPLIEARLQSEELSTAGQIALVRQLASAGDPAIATLEKLTSREREPIVRVNAIDQISRVKPVTDRATDILRSILREGEPRDRIEALKALDRMGANSPEFVEELRQIMESDAPENLRRQAKESLDRASPRRTFDDRD